jgi:D-3-phosphoglycerate dehydrogenase
VLDGIAAELVASGCRVIRGQPPKPGGRSEYPQEEWPRLFGETDVMLISVRTHCPPELLRAAPRLRAIVFPTIGTEAVDLAYASELGLIVGYGPTDENFTGTAEATVLLIAALLLDLPGKQRITRLNLPRPTFSQMKARMISGQTIGLVGLGRVGRAVARRLQNWDVEILAFDPFVSRDSVPAGVQMVELPQLLARSDVVSIHVTLSKETQHLIGAAELAQLKPMSYLVNTARGGAVDDAALLAALQSRRLAGAALDVFSSEPLPLDSPFRELDNVILTAHMIGHVQNMHQSFIRAGVENISRVLRGEPPLYVRNPDALDFWRKRLAALAKR